MTILENMSFEEVVEVYGAFPLKVDFLEAGNSALEKYGIQAVQEGRKIRIHYLSRRYYDEEDLEDLRWNGFEDEDIEDVRKWTLEADAYIRLGGNDRNRVRKVNTNYYIAGLGEDDDVWAYDGVTEEDDSVGLEAILAFLNAAVDAE